MRLEFTTDEHDFLWWLMDSCLQIREMFLKYVDLVRLLLQEPGPGHIGKIIQTEEPELVTSKTGLLGPAQVNVQTLAHVSGARNDSTLSDGAMFGLGDSTRLTWGSCRSR